MKRSSLVLSIAWALALLTLLVARPLGAQPKSEITEYFNHAEFRANASSLTVITFDERGQGNGVLTGNEYAARGLTIVQRDRLPINILIAKDNQYYHPTNFNSQPNGISSANGEITVTGLSAPTTSTLFSRNQQMRWVFGLGTSTARPKSNFPPQASARCRCGDGCTKV